MSPIMPAPIHPIYVDPLVQVTVDSYHGPHASQARSVGSRHAHRWCHLFSDVPSCPELHAFAESLGQRREWFQGDHYDLVPPRRHRAVELGAIEVTTSQAAEIMRRW